MAVKIKLTRLGKIRNPQYRIAVADARTRRDGRSIEVIGRYHPKEEPSLIEIDSERAQYWLERRRPAHRARPAAAEDHRRLAEVQGPAGAEGTLKVKEPKPSKLDLFNAALAEADGAPSRRGHPGEEEEGARQEGRGGRTAEAAASSPPPRLLPSSLPEAAAVEPAAEAAETAAE